MQKSRIEWTNYSVNPILGLCPVGCSYCYARRMYKRFKWNPDIRYKFGWELEIAHIKNPSRIFVGSTMELFGDWLRPEYLDEIFTVCKLFPCHTFIFLTKKPQNLIKYSPFPDNCWVGVSIPNEFVLARDEIFTKLSDVEAKVKFISFEPLQSKIVEPYLLDIGFKIAGISWVIIGQQTPQNKKTTPKIEWIQDIVKSADYANIPVFLKNNLKKGIFIRNEEQAEHQTFQETFSWAFDMECFNKTGETRLRQELSK